MLEQQQQYNPKNDDMQALTAPLGPLSPQQTLTLIALSHEGKLQKVIEISAILCTEDLKQFRAVLDSCIAKEN